MFYVPRGLMKGVFGGFSVSISLSGNDLVLLIRILVLNPLKGDVASRTENKKKTIIFRILGL